jgi:DnaJ-domain-containing protein 1
MKKHWKGDDLNRVEETRNAVSAYKKMKDMLADALYVFGLQINDLRDAKSRSKKYRHEMDRLWEKYDYLQNQYHSVRATYHEHRKALKAVQAEMEEK